jgi:hypothetical protein
MNDYFVYIYCYPNTVCETICIDDRLQLPGKPLYVGYGQNLRHLQHLKEAISEKMKPTPKNKAIQKLLLADTPPHIIKVNTGLSKQDACQLEIRLIAEIGTKAKIDRVTKRGPLLNMHRGGQGGYIPRSPEVLKRLSEKLKGRIITPEWRAKISASKKNVPLSPERKAAFIAAGANRTRSEEEKRRRGKSISQALLARTSEELESWAQKRRTNGWFCEEAIRRREQRKTDGYFRKNIQSFKAVSPSGENIAGDDLTNFCIANDLDPQNAWLNLKRNGPIKKGPMKGWRFTL